MQKMVRAWTTSGNITVTLEEVKPQNHNAKIHVSGQAKVDGGIRYLCEVLYPTRYYVARAQVVGTRVSEVSKDPLMQAQMMLSACRSSPIFQLSEL